MKKILFTLVAFGLFWIVLWFNESFDLDQDHSVSSSLRSPTDLVPGVEGSTSVGRGDEAPGNDVLNESVIVKAFEAFFEQPIDLYGKVVDQEGNPIVGAEVRFILGDIDGGYSPELTETDVNGEFRILDRNGSSLAVYTSLDGFYAGSESRVVVSPGDPSSKDHPVVFVLHRKGQMDPVYYTRHASVSLQSSEGLICFDLVDGRFVGEKAGQLNIEISVDANEDRFPFSWSYKITVPGGGLQIRGDRFDFVAPEGGYVECIEKNNDYDSEDWERAFNRGLFILLGDGTFARCKLSFNALGRSRAIKVYLDDVVHNPSGSRNLEFDSANPLILKR
jgi:hypothetical protein